MSQEEDEPHRTYRIDFKTGSWLRPDSEPGDYIRKIWGEITCTEELDAVERTTRAGTVEGYVIRVDRILDDGEDLFEACDAHSQTLHDYSCVLFNFRRREWKHSIDRQFGGIIARDALILDKVEVLPGHR